MTSSTVPRTRLESLDLLRGVAVLLVIFRHAAAPPDSVASFVATPFGLLLQVGWVGVDLFFVLSGFLVAGLLFAEHRRHGFIRPGRFLIRRGLKIYPPFYVLLAATVVVWKLQGADLDADFTGRLLAEIFYVQNYFGGFWNHTWSLAVEEHFYILLALAAAVGVRRSSSKPFAWVPVAALLLAGTGLIWRSWIALNSPFQFLTHVFPTHLRLDALAIGVALSYLYHYRTDGLQALARRFRPLLWTVGLACFSVPFLGPQEETPFIIGPGFLLISLGAACLLAAMVPGSLDPGAPVPKAVRWMASVGVYSYSVYLWHMPVQWWLMPELRPSLGLILPMETTLGFVVDFLVYASASVALGVVMARLVEIPVLYFRDRRFPSRAAAVPPEDQPGLA